MAPQLSGLRETLALLFSGISYGRSRDSNEIGGTISIHPVIDELSRGYKVVLSIVCIHRFPQGKWTQIGCQCRLALRCVARVARAGSEKSSLRPLIDVEIFLSKTYPSLLVYDVCGAGHSQKLLRYARPLRAVGASCRPAGRISMDLTKSILPARGAHRACG